MGRVSPPRGQSKRPILRDKHEYKKTETANSCMGCLSLLSGDYCPCRRRTSPRLALGAVFCESTDGRRVDDDAGWTLLGVTLALELGGAIALFKLRRIAFPLFVGAFGCTLLQMTMHHQDNTVSGPGNHFPVLWLVIDLFVCAYAWRLRSRSALT